MDANEYWKEVAEIAEIILDEVLTDCRADEEEDEDNIRERLGERLWETIDGHQWVIYTAYNYDVMKHSPNDGYSAENFGADTIIQDGALNTSAIAFGALYADVSEKLWEAFDSRDEDDS